MIRKRLFSNWILMNTVDFSEKRIIGVIRKDRTIFKIKQPKGKNR